MTRVNLSTIHLTKGGFIVPHSTFVENTMPSDYAKAYLRDRELFFHLFCKIPWCLFQFTPIISGVKWGRPNSENPRYNGDAGPVDTQ